MRVRALLGVLLDWNARWWPVLTVALALVVVTLSLTPLPGAEGGLVSRTDKLQHLVAYAALAGPAALARPKGWMRVLVALAALGGIVEVIQPLVNRGMHLSDFAASAAGLAAGALAAALLRRLAGIGTPAARNVGAALWRR